MAAKQILVVVDPTTDEKQPVIERAAWLAERAGPRCSYSPATTTRTSMRVASRQSGSPRRVRAPHCVGEPQGRCEVRRGASRRRQKCARPRLPEVCLESAVKQQHADFLVMGAVARRGVVKRLLLGSTAARVLDRLPCDIVVIKPAELALPH